MSSHLSLNINYHTSSTELCEIGKKFDTDKSSQRTTITKSMHCHPYTIFYDSIFKNYKNEKLNIAELGILEGASLLMWNEYFVNSKIYGFDYNEQFINAFQTNHKNENIILSKMDIANADNILTSFKNINIMYDIIIDDTTHQFDDQIRIIEIAYLYLKPGGILIIEDILKNIMKRIIFVSYIIFYIIFKIIILCLWNI